VLRLESFLLADKQSFVPRSLASVDSTYRHRGSSAIPPTARSIASALFITTALSGSFQTEFPNGRFWRKASFAVCDRRIAVIRRCKECLSALQLSETLNQQFGENSDFPCGVLTGRPDDEQAARRNRIARHDLNKGAGIQTALDEVFRKPSDAEPRYRSSGESGTVVRFELPSPTMSTKRSL
jgi:hypothetical protein